MSKSREIRMSFRLNLEEWHMLDDLITRFKTNKSDLIRALIYNAYNKQVWEK